MPNKIKKLIRKFIFSVSERYTWSVCPGQSMRHPEFGGERLLWSAICGQRKAKGMYMLMDSHSSR